MRAKVKSLEPVLQGRLSGVLRTRKIAREYKEAGFKVVNSRVLLEPRTARRVRATRQKPGEYMTIRRFVGKDGKTVIEQVIMPASIRNFDDFLSSLQNGDFDHLKRPKDYWAFQFYGNNSVRPFMDVPDMLNWLEHYKAIQADEPGAWEHFILYRVYPPGAWDSGGGPSQMRRRQRHGKTVQDRRLEGGKRQSRAHMTMDELRALDRKRKREKREAETPALAEARKAKNRQSMRLARAEKYAASGGPKRIYKRRKP